MRPLSIRMFLFALFARMAVDPAAAADMGTAFTYQGRLVKSGTPVSSSSPHCTFTFSLWDAAAGGNQMGNSPQSTVGVAVVAGLFTTNVDFGLDGLNGTARWLEINVQCPGDAMATTLAPRQELKPAAHALALPGLYTQQAVSAPNIIGGHTDNSIEAGMAGATIAGGGLSGEGNFIADLWGTISGGSGNTAGSDDADINTAQFATVSGGRFNESSGPHSFIGGGQSNIASFDHATVAGGWNNRALYLRATVGGGRDNTANFGAATVAGGSGNSACGNFASVGGGAANNACAQYATVAGGDSNNINPTGSAAVISGGTGNSSEGANSVVGGGQGNSAQASFDVVDGGILNVTSGGWATVGGGDSNQATAAHSIVAGGQTNLASGEYSAVGGGRSNAASGPYGTIAGGEDNTASNLAFVGGGQVNIASGTNAAIGGGGGNHATATFATVGGGWENKALAQYATISGGAPRNPANASSTNNRVFDEYGTIGGGGGNRAGSDDADPLTAAFATVAGGDSNRARSQVSTVGGGRNNETFDQSFSGSCRDCPSTPCDSVNLCPIGCGFCEIGGQTVGGGVNNRAIGAFSTVSGGGRITGDGHVAIAPYSTIAGGYSNSTYGSFAATVGGGAQNTASGYAASVAGGNGNAAVGRHATVGGGQANAAEGAYSSVPGGFDNSAGADFSFAGGRRASVRDAFAAGDDPDTCPTSSTCGDEGTFVWADADPLGSGDFISTGSNQFLMRAAGGVGLNTNAPNATLAVYSTDGGNVGDAVLNLVADSDNNDESDTPYIKFGADGGTNSAFIGLGGIAGTPFDGINVIDSLGNALILYTPASTRPLQFGGNGKMAMTIGDGKVGIGTNAPTAPLHVIGDNVLPVVIDKKTSDGNLVVFGRDGTGVGAISVSAGTVTYGPFTGAHYARTDQTIERGMLVTMTGDNQKRAAEPGAEPHYGIVRSTKANDATCLGAYLGLLEPIKAASLDNPHQVMAVGNGDMWVVDTGRDIHAGDYLISSDVIGHAMLDDDERFAVGHVVARAAEPVAWAETSEEIDGRKHQRISVFFESFSRGSEKLSQVLQAQQFLIAMLRQQVEAARNLESERVTQSMHFEAEKASLEARLAAIERLVAEFAPPRTVGH